MRGWELKAFALRHTDFSHVMLLDADNVPLADPTYLFDSEPFKATGAIFWPDEDRIAPDSKIHAIFGVTPRGEYSFETGQIVLDRRRVWPALNLALHFNEHSDFYYRYFHGDPGTFHLAWRYLEYPYAMPPFPMRRLRGVMCQHDFEGRRLFQHRHGPKWDSPEHEIDGFALEQECRQYCYELERLWTSDCARG